MKFRCATKDKKDKNKQVENSEIPKQAEISRNQMKTNKTYTDIVHNLGDNEHYIRDFFLLVDKKPNKRKKGNKGTKRNHK